MIYFKLSATIFVLILLLSFIATKIDDRILFSTREDVFMSFISSLCHNLMQGGWIIIFVFICAGIWTI